MNLILLFREDFISGGVDGAGGKVRLAGRRCEHVRSIQRAVPGDRLCVGLVGGRIGQGTVLRIEDDGLEMEVAFERDPPPALPVTLVVALPRPLVLKRFLITATAMGVKRIFLIQSNRVERSFWNSKLLRDGELIQSLVLGLEQARDTQLPDVEMRTRFRPFVEDELPDLVKGTRGLVAHPDAAHACPRDVDGDVTLVIGPEGGFVPYEIEKFEASGCAAVHLGERILRIEAALPALLGRLF